MGGSLLENGFRSAATAPGPPALSSSTIEGVTPAASLTERIWTADKAKQNMALYHKSGIVCAALTPIAIAYPNLACDVVLGAVFPLHAYVALHAVVSDYAPKAAEVPLRALVVAGTGLTILGMQVCNFRGEGMTRATLRLWNPKKADE